MQARILSLRVAPEVLEELTSIYHTSLLPELRQQRGFSALLLLCDAETGKALELTLLDSEDARQESEEEGGVLDQKLDTLTKTLGVMPKLKTTTRKLSLHL